MPILLNPDLAAHEPHPDAAGSPCNDTPAGPSTDRSGPAWMTSLK